MALGDGHGDSAAIDLTRRGLDDARHAAAPRRLEHVKRAYHVGVHVGLRGDVGVRNADEGGEVEDDILPLNDSADQGGVADIAADELNRLERRGRKVV